MNAKTFGGGGDVPAQASFDFPRPRRPMTRESDVVYAAALALRRRGPLRRHAGGDSPSLHSGRQPGGGVVLDPFAGAGTVGVVAERLGRDSILIEINPAYAEMAERRIRADAPLLAAVS